MNILFRSFAAVLLAGLAAVSNAQTFPSKAVHILVPFPPGGAADLLTRALGKKLQEAWGQPVVADNRPGRAAISPPRRWPRARRTDTPC